MVPAHAWAPEPATGADADALVSLAAAAEGGADDASLAIASEEACAPATAAVGADTPAGAWAVVALLALAVFDIAPLAPAAPVVAAAAGAAVATLGVLPAAAVAGADAPGAATAEAGRAMAAVPVDAAWTGALATTAAEAGLAPGCGTFSTEPIFRRLGLFPANALGLAANSTFAMFCLTVRSVECVSSPAMSVSDCPF